jgi:ribosomal protein S27E
MTVLPPEVRGSPVVYVPCLRCGDARIVWNAVLQRIIRCPACTLRLPRNDPSGLRQVTAAEARRRKRAVALVVAEAITGSTVRISRLDPEFITTNRVMERWQAGNLSGLPRTNEDWAELEQAAVEQEDTFTSRPSLPPQLDDATAVVVDQTYEHSPPVIYEFVSEWYRYDVPIEVMCKRRRLNRDEIYQEWHAVLRYLRQKFERSGHADLIAMVRALP